MMLIEDGTLVAVFGPYVARVNGTSGDLMAVRTPCCARCAICFAC